jgi:hypothetical protein
MELSLHGRTPFHQPEISMTTKPLALEPLVLAMLSAFVLSACMGHADMHVDAPMSSSMSSDAMQDPTGGGAMMYPGRTSPTTRSTRRITSRWSRQ